MSDMIITQSSGMVHISGKFRIAHAGEAPSNRGPLQGLFMFSDPVTMVPYALVRLPTGEYVAMLLQDAVRLTMPNAPPIAPVPTDQKED